MNTPKGLPSKGAASALEIYNAVGFALTIWEASEDVLMGLFKVLCAEREPTAFSAYVMSPRNRRTAMMKLALDRYKDRFQNEEADQVRAVLKALDKLAETRNEIAHGHCSDYESSDPSGVVMSGNYLMPSWNEGHWHERSPRYAHNVETLKSFTASVRQHRAAIMDIDSAIRIRTQEAYNKLDDETKSVLNLARSVAYGDLQPHLIPKVLKRVQPT